MTRKFIEKVHNTFNVLNYQPTSKLDFDEFQKAANRQLTHSKDLFDAKKVVCAYQFALKKWNAIEKIFNKKLSEFNQYNQDKKASIPTVSDDEAVGKFFVTNGITKKLKEIYVTSFNLDDELCCFDYKHGKYSFFDDNIYYLKFSQLSSNKMRLFGVENNPICDIVLTDDYSILLDKNKSQYVLSPIDGYICVYEKEYADSISCTDKFDLDKRIADIQQDVLNENTELGVAELTIYPDDQDVEMLILFAASTFLLYHNYLESQMAISIATTSFIINRR